MIGYYYIRGYLQGAVNAGFNPQDIQTAANIDAAIYQDPTAVIDGEQFNNLILTIRRALNDLYMQVPGKLAMDQASALTAVKEETLGEGIRPLIGFINAVRSDEERECVVDEEGELLQLINGDIPIARIAENGRLLRAG